MQYYCAQCGRLFNTVRVRKYCDECRELAKRICNNMYSMGYCRNRRDKEREMSIYATNECISGLMDQLSELTKKRDALKAEVERLRAGADRLLWNLAKCSTIACSKTPTEFNREWAKPALHEVNELAKEYQDLKAEVERLKAELKIAESFHRVAIKERDAERLCNEQLKRTTVSTKYHDEIVAEAVKERVAETSRLRGALHEISLCSQNSTSSKDECGRIARIALGEAGKKEPEKTPVCSA